jgi:hypothetical protein
VGTLINQAQYDILYSAGTTSAVAGAAINGFQYDSTTGNPAAATATQLGTLANQAQYAIILSGGTTSALTSLATSSTTGAILASGGSSANPAYDTHATLSVGALSLGAAGTAGSIVLGGSSSGTATINTSSTGTLQLPSGTTATSMSLTTPVLGTPTSGTITNLTGTCTSCQANTVTALSNYLYKSSNLTTSATVGPSSASGSWTAPGTGWYQIEVDATLTTAGSGGTFVAGEECGGASNLTDGATATLATQYSSSSATLTCYIASGNSFAYYIGFTGASGSPTVTYRYTVIAH